MKSLSTFVFALIVVLFGTFSQSRSDIVLPSDFAQNEGILQPEQISSLSRLLEFGFEETDEQLQERYDKLNEFQQNHQESLDRSLLYYTELTDSSQSSPFSQKQIKTIIDILIRVGANLEAENINRETSQEVANRTGNSEVEQQFADAWLSKQLEGNFAFTFDAVGILNWRNGIIPHDFDNVLKYHLTIDRMRRLLSSNETQQNSIVARTKNACQRVFRSLGL